VLWLQSLFAAIDLAPPLDDREIPQDLSIPRRTRRRNRPGFSNIERNQQLIREQEEILRTQFPNLAVSEDENGAEGGGENEEIGGEEEAEAAADEAERESSHQPSTPRPFASPSQASILGSSSQIPSQTSTPHTTSLLMRTRHALSLPSPLSLSSAQPPPNPSISADGKWAPQHQWTHFYDMMYAKRCMAILTHRSPRKSNLVIMKGKQWIIDWATGKLTRCEPPEYGEITSEAGAAKAPVLLPQSAAPTAVA